MRYFSIKKNDIANGPGVRVSVFVSGCRRHCPFCFNQVAADFAAGAAFDEDTIQEIVEALRPSYVSGITMLGGEPMEPENQEGVLTLLKRVREELPNKSIWLYSGFTLDELVGTKSVLPPYKKEVRGPYTDELLGVLDVLVDGPFVQELYDIRLRFRGSSNQRIIDMPKSLEKLEQEGGVLSFKDLGQTFTPILWQDDELLSHGL